MFLTIYRRIKTTFTLLTAVFILNTGSALAQQAHLTHLLDALVTEEKQLEAEEAEAEVPCELEGQDIVDNCRVFGVDSLQCIRAEMREAICLGQHHCSTEQWNHLNELLNSELNQCLDEAGESEVEQLKCHRDHLYAITQACQDEASHPGTIAEIERQVCAADGRQRYLTCIEDTCPDRTTNSCILYCSSVKLAYVSRCLYVENPPTPQQAACELELQQCLDRATNYRQGALCYYRYNACITPPVA